MLKGIIYLNIALNNTFDGCHEGLLLAGGDAHVLLDEDVGFK